MNIDIALKIAADAHAGQKDKAGAPYILHPLRLMSRLKSNNQKIVALLHDVVEDSNISIEDLARLGFSEEIINAIICLTRRPEESYEAFIKRASQNGIARLLKIEDLKDNLDLSRFQHQLSDQDLKRTQKYHSALTLLENNNCHLA